MASSQSEDEQEDWNNPNWDKEESDLPQNFYIQSEDSNPGSSNVVLGAKETKAGLVSRMVLNDNKAGMQGLDKERINKIILEASKGSRFFENELKKEQQVNARIGEQQQKLKLLSQEQLKRGEKETDQLLLELEDSRDLSRTIVHMDMDMFYAAVEMRRDPSLKNKPMAVGGTGMLSTSNYLARRYGVRAAMPGFIGKKLCPDLVIVRPKFQLYRKVSQEVRAILALYDPDFSPMSLDEAYLDFTEHLIKRKGIPESDRTFYYKQKGVEFDDLPLCCDNKLPQVLTNKDFEDKTPRSGEHPVHNDESLETEDKVEHEDDNSSDEDNESTKQALAKDYQLIVHQCGSCGKITNGDGRVLDRIVFDHSVEDAVAEMRLKIEIKTQLTASAGIAPNTMLSKICSDMNKPNGQYRIHPRREDILTFLKDLPIRKVCGIGKVSEKMLAALGVIKCPDIIKMRGAICHLHSSISYQHLMSLALGISSNVIQSDGERKSMSTERTFRELSKPEDLTKKCEELCQALAKDLQEEGLMGRTVTLKLKTVTFEVKTRAQSLKHATNEVREIYCTALDVLKREIQAVAPAPLKLRLMGVRMSNFLDTNEKQDQKSITSFLQKGKSAATSSDITQKQDGTPSSSTTSPVNDSKTNKGNIVTMFSNAAPALQKYTCPVCERTISCRNLCAFNKHIDQCLQGKTANDGSTSIDEASPVKSDLGQTDNKHKRPTKKFTIDDPLSKIWAAENKSPTFEVVDPLSKRDSCLCPSSESERLDELNCDITEEAAQGKVAMNVFVCPICDKDHSDLSAEDFNYHVEECLNKQAIQDILQAEKSSNSMKRPDAPSDASNKSKKAKIGQCPQTIDSFFK